MANIRTFKTAFVGGEVTPELFGRVDLDKEQSGLALCENFVVLPHGPVQNRAGFRFCNAAKLGDAVTRIIGFSFSNTQTFAIELGAGYFRFFSFGQYVLAPGSDIVSNGSFIAGSLTGWTDASSSGSWIDGYVGNGLVLNATPIPGTGGLGNAVADQALTTVAGDVYTVIVTVPTSPYSNTVPVTLAVGSTLGGSDLLSESLLPGLTSYSFSFTAAGTTSYLALTATTPLLSGSIYQAGTGFVSFVSVTGPGTGAAYEVANSYAAADLFNLHYVQSGDIVTFAHPDYPPMELRRYGNQDWTFTPISFATSLTPPSSLTATSSYPSPPGDFPSGYTGATVYTYHYQVTSVNSDGLEESLPSNNASCLNNLAVPGATNTLAWTPPSPPPAYYNIYKGINGGGLGFVAQALGSHTGFSDGNITPDMTQSPPIQDNVLASPGNYPAAVGYYEQRRVFGGTNNDPQSFWATQPGTQSNMNYSLPSQASDRLSVTIAAQRANFIQHIVALLDMVLLTASTEWRVFTASGDALTPSTLTVKAQWQNGASDVQPVVVNNACLYASSQGGHVRALSYEWTLNGYKSDDLCLLARHLFDFDSVLDLAFCRSPYPVLWVVSSSGLLLGLTYLPDQQVMAWHRHSTDGVFESVCAVMEGNVDVLYAVVRRQINGVWSRYVERLDTRAYNGVIENAFFVDCGASYTAPAGTFSLDLVHGTYDCAVTGHGLTNGQSYSFVFSPLTWRGTFTVTIAGTLADVMCSVPGHGLTSGAVVALSFSEPVYDGQYSVTVVDANTFTLYLAISLVTENLTGAVSFTAADPNDGSHVVTVSDANHFSVPVVGGPAAGTVQQVVSSISGLTWLEGAAVSVLADGKVQRGLSVSGGGVLTLTTPASVVQVGLPYTATMETPPQAIAGDPAFGQGRIKAVNVIWARCVDFTGCVVGSAGSKRRVPVGPLQTDSAGNPALANGEFRVKPFGNWNTDGAVVISQVDPLPLTVADLCFEVSVEG
ncbi:MAG: hypothetical protein PHW13_11980 [Methylococcales bacterium]|nr:hypothetical protein [Methylococcales bacterium]